MNSEKVKKAVEIYGQDTVSTAISVVSISDPDGACCHAEDMGMDDLAECIRFLYFED